MRLLYDRRGSFRIVRDNNEYVNALRNQLLRLAKLRGIIAVRGQHLHIAAELFDFGRENIPILLPTLFL
ncbi:hypothetical protein D3C77_447590 [compost metagenome]